MLFLLDDVIGNATLANTSGTIVSELPLDNLKALSKSRVTRSAGGGSLEITGVLSTQANVNGFIIGQHNFPEDTIYQLELYDNLTLSGTPVTYSGQGQKIVTAEQEAISPLEYQYNLAIWFDTIFNIGSFKLILGSSTISHYQIGRLIMGEAIDMSIGASYGHNIYWTENSNQYRTEAGTLRTDIYTPNKVIEFSLGTIYERERSNVQRSLASIGKRTEFFISLFPQDCITSRELDYSGIVKMTKVPKYPEFAQDLYSAKYVVEEV